MARRVRPLPRHGTNSARAAECECAWYRLLQEIDRSLMYGPIGESARAAALWPLRPRLSILAANLSLESRERGRGARGGAERPVRARARDRTRRHRHRLACARPEARPAG